jgi:hypothetical protein
MKDVSTVRRGDVATIRRRQMPTLGEVAEEFTKQRVAEPATIESLEFRLRYALDGPKLDGAGWRDVKIRGLSRRDWPRKPSFAGTSIGAPRFELGTSSPPD